MRSKYLIAIIFLLILSLSIPRSAQSQGNREGDRREFEIQFFKGKSPASVYRNMSVLQSFNLRMKIKIIIEQLLLGPSPEEIELGYTSLIPRNTQLLDLQIKQEEIHFYLSNQFVSGSMEDFFLDDKIRQFINSLLPFEQIRGFYFWVEDGQGGFKPLDYFIDQSKIKDIREQIDRYHRLHGIKPFYFVPPSKKNFFPFGASLWGKTVFLSAGHGWIFSQGAWRTQRSRIKWKNCGFCRGILEDFSNAEIINFHLFPMLRRAGAQVYTARETDHSTFEQIVDDNDAGYSEAGNNFADGTSTQLGYKGDYRVLNAMKKDAAVFRPTFKKSGFYNVSLRFVAGSNRTSAAKVSVRHGYGTTVFLVDQRQNGGRFLYLGTFYFDPDQKGEVEIGPGQEEDKYLIADAVRFGGGIDQTVIDGKTSNKARWQMSALYHIPYINRHINSYSSDVSARPLYANFLGADAYVSLHSNAAGSAVKNISGTITFRHNCLLPSSQSTSPSSCDHPKGSYDLQEKVHTAIIDNLRQNWDENWKNRGQIMANFGELRNLKNIPGILIESAFHDCTENPTGTNPPAMPDNQALHHPKFRQQLARGIYQGLVEYFNPGAKLTLSPPTNLRLYNQASSGKLVLEFESVKGAKGYRVYIGHNSLAYDHGTLIHKNHFELSGLKKGETVYLRVSTLNEGGESFPSETIGARFGGPGKEAPILLVNGFDRQDAYVQVADNTFDYSFRIGRAIVAIPGQQYFFDSCSNEAVENGFIDLNNYRAVVYSLGEESSLDETFSHKEQEKVEKYLDQGGALLVSGSEIAYELSHKGDSKDLQFLHNYLKTSYLEDDADLYQTVPIKGKLFDSLKTIEFDDGTQGSYNVDYPDIISSFGGSETILEYSDDKKHGAAISYDGPFKLVFLAFPLETIFPEQTRIDILELIFEFFNTGLGGNSIDGGPDSGEEMDSEEAENADGGVLIEGYDGSMIIDQADGGTTDNSAEEEFPETDTPFTAKKAPLFEAIPKGLKSVFEPNAGCQCSSVP